jgi:hypothetical protein
MIFLPATLLTKRLAAALPSWPQQEHNVVMFPIDIDARAGAEYRVVFTGVYRRPFPSAKFLKRFILLLLAFIAVHGQRR